ncbi:MAG TPA: choice-of-anchor G family protein [Jatrophihabitantaceae bacterium]|nr:choice-of-anchor G family protein [Jatrophihabitantaceae bacterium]
MSTTMSELDPSSATRPGLARRVLAAGLTAGLAIAATAMFGTQPASAATLPNSQSVGRFLDGAVGNSNLQQIVDLKDARAVNPGSVSDQNPLDVNVLQALDLPLTGALQFPQLLGIKLGAANQVAVAKADGYSYGASGAVLNSGGVSVGGNNNAFPANATIDLSASGIAGNSPVPVPGGGTADLLGGVKVTIGGVAALAQTPAGVGKPGSTSYGIADLKIVAASPLLADLLGNVGDVLGGLLTSLNAILGLSAQCPLLNGDLPDLSLENGAVTLSASDGGLTVDLAQLLDVLHLNLNTLAPNTDLIDLLLDYISSPGGLADGLGNLINGLFTGPNSLKSQVDACATGATKTLADALFGLGSQLQTTLGTLLGGLQLPGGGSALAPLGTVLKKLVDIGVNVQPNGPAGTFTSQLRATPNQATPVVPGQTIVRAIEVNLVGDPLATLALANAAAGPSNPASVAPSSGPPNTNVPTGVPAGFGKPNDGTPALPLVLLSVGVMLAAGGAAAWKLRGRHI